MTVSEPAKPEAPPGGIDIEARLLRARQVFLWGEVNEDSARAVITRLALLEAEDPAAEICLYINSPGGVVQDGLAIYDAMQAVRPPVCTVVTGLAASAGSLIQAGGAPGRRLAWPHARLMIHQPLLAGEYTASASDLEIQARELLHARDLVNRLLAEHSGQPLERVRRDTDRNYWMSAQEARDYGFIDEIVTRLTPTA